MVWRRNKEAKNDKTYSFKNERNKKIIKVHELYAMPKRQVRTAKRPV